MLVFLFSPLNVSAFETEGVPTAIIGSMHTAGEPIHQEITKDGLHFLKSSVRQLLADQHPQIELDQSSPNHFDNCQFTESVDLINSRYDNAVGFLNPKSPNLDGARKEFGKILHAAQDFYSHTNWIEMKRTDLIDPWYDHWKPLKGYTSTSNKNPVFVLEQQPNSIFSDFTIYKNGKTFTVNHELWDATGEGRKAGLISGTYGEAHESHCPPNASIPHGGKLLNRFFRTPDYTEFPNELNKDNPAIKGHKAARALATEQTTHEFCRLVVLTNEKWGMSGVNLIYDNWVEDKKFLEKTCPAIEESHTSIGSDDGSYIHDSNAGKSNSVMVNPTIPNWVKNNAKWWSQGIVSDREFATSLGFLIKEKILKVEDVVINSDGSIAISEGISIPKWIRTNAQWWVDGAISDDDFKQGIQFMVKEKLIDFVQKPSSQKTAMLNTKDFEEFSQLQSNIVLASNYALKQLLELQNFLASSYDYSATNAWNEYSKTKDDNAMQHAIFLEDKASFYSDESLKTVKTLKDSEQKTKQFFETLRKSGFDDFKLKQNAENELDITDSDSKIKDVNELDNAEKDLKKTDNFIKNTIERAELVGQTQIGNLPDSGESQSSRYSFSFGVGKIEDSDSKYHGINSLTWARACTTSSECDSLIGEVCTDETKRCIPTWFGIEHAWSPVDIMEYPNDSNYNNMPQSESTESDTHQISVIMVKGGYFPIAQFSTWQWKGECDDATHYHSNSGHAISVTLQTMGDPDSQECGYGKVSQLPISTISMSDADIQGFMELTNIDPRNNKAMFGGSGP